MANDVCIAIETKKPLAVEAEVGIGKSYAYLVPAVLQFCRKHRQIVIATSTIALQEQLYVDVHNVMKMLGVSAEIILAKGMTNYVCLRKVHGFCRRYPNNLFFSRLCSFLDSGKQDKSQINMNISEKEWDKIAVTNFGNKYCQQCTYSRKCAYGIMRSRLIYGDNIVICNQNMLVSHCINELDSKRIFNSKMETVIIDEAHNIEEKFRSAFTESYSRNEIIQAVKKCETDKKSSKLAEELKDDIIKFFTLLKAQVKEQQTKNDDDTTTFFFRKSKEISALMRKIRKNITVVEIKNELSEIYFFLRNAENVSENHIVWIEKNPEIRLCICKKDIRNDISQLLFRNGSVILTSATISDRQNRTPEKRCEYYLKSIGFPVYGRVAEPKKSPFDYEKNTMLYVSTTMPFPKYDRKEEYRESSIPEIVKLLEVTDGKTLILFTSKTDMEYVYKKLSNMHLPYKIYIQVNHSSQVYVLEKFRNDVNSVILGTGTYWEGINVEGESLSQVMIYKLPFPVPEPIISYKMSAVKNPVDDIAIPEMIIKLRQGVGRLIRSKSDKGIVSILDSRLSSKSKSGYKKRIFDSLPMKNITENIEEIRNFWNQITEV